MPTLKKSRSNGSTNGHSNGNGNGNGHAKPENRVAKHLRGNGDADNGVENLDKVRDILFGSHMRDHDRRFGRLEETVVRETSDVRDEVKKRLDTVETFIRKEVQALLERIKTEQSQRGDSIKDVAQELKDSIKAFQLRAGQLQEQAAEAQRELRQDILDQSKNLRDEMQQTRVDLSGQIERTASELRTTKVDKTTLAEMFTEFAERLSAIEK